jgi:Elongation factor P, C-terminal
VTLEVVDAAGPIRGGSDAAWKPARLDTGLEIMVPLFIAPGEKIRVNTTGANTLHAKARRGSKGKIKTYRVQEDMKRETSGARRTKECLLCHAKDEKDRYPCFYL